MATLLVCVSNDCLPHRIDEHSSSQVVTNDSIAGDEFVMRFV